MKHLMMGTFVLLTLVWSTSAPAQLILSKKTKANPVQRVPELILIVKTDSDERKRTHAAEELRDYDTAVFTEIVPVLADVLLNDKKVGVRSEALASLAKIRPVSTTAGQAIEKAAASDESLRVRVQAKAALAKYQLAGYGSRKSDAPPPKKPATDEPPIAPKAPARSADPLPKFQPLPSVKAPPRPLPPGVASPLPKPPGPSLYPD